MFYIPTDVHYREYRIVWDVQPRPETPFWMGKVAVIFTGNVPGKKSVHRIPNDACFTSEEEARDQLIGAAKDWIDKSMETSETE